MLTVLRCASFVPGSESCIHFLLYAAALLYISSLIFQLIKKRGWSFAFLLLGFVGHTAYQVLRGWMSGMFISNPMFDTFFLMPWSVALLIILKQLKSKEKRNDNATLALLVFFALLAVFYPKGMSYLGPNKHSLWATMYFITDVMGRACFYVGALFSLLLVLRRNTLPDYHGFLVWGFVLFTLAQVTGAVWCFLGWATTFQWVYVHMESAAIWCFFANYLHLQFLPAWDEQRKAKFALAGGVMMLVFYLHNYLAYFTVPRIGG